MIKHICKTCGKEFFNEKTVFTYCSRKCAGIGHSKFMKGRPAWNKNKRCPQWSGKKHWGWKGGLIKKTCQLCGKTYKVPKCRDKKTKYCSQKCSNKMNLPHSGIKNNNWKGGRKIHDRGYIMLINKSHPFATKAGYVHEHRLVMEKHLGRFLKPQEVVHHINKIHNDNRIENLKLFPNNASHINYHRKLSKKA